MKRAPLPPEFRSAPFRTAQATAARIPRSRLRARDLDASVYGVRAAAGASDELRLRCAMFAQRLGERVFFSHVTAALLLGAPLPLPLERRRDLDVSLAAPAPSPHARGIRGHSVRVRDLDVGVIANLRVTSPERTWCDLASILTLDNLVAVGDYFIHRELPQTSHDRLRDAVRLAVGRRGVRTLTRAIELLDERAESRQESRLRVLIVCAGLPTPRINRTLVNATTGREVRIDLTLDEFMIAIEYQGDYHRTQEQWRRDMTRRSQLEAQGWYVMEINGDDLRDPAELVARIQAVLSMQARRLAVR